MNKLVLLFGLLFHTIHTNAQGPAITSWLQNTTTTGSYYTSSSTAISNGILVNCQKVEYSNDYVYVSATGIPAYPTGPFQDGNPSQAEDQSKIFKFPLNPQQNTGTPTSTTMGNIGVFINGVALFDYRDGVAWNNNTGALCGGPGNPSCPGPPGTMDWNRDAIPAEMDGFDCSKGHPAMGNYHHHQNPSAFKLDLNVVSTICNIYDADGLYSLDSTQHSPLIGFAYDGFPIYGGYGYKNEDGTGGVARIKSGYQLQSITTRTNGPAVNSTYFLGYFREDYEFITHPGEEDYLDEHNGRTCNTPEYPNGTYAYFATIDENWNSAYPYAVGPAFYGVWSDASVNSVTESTTVYVPTPCVDPVAAFSYSSTGLNSSFSNSSQITGTASYAWDFGDLSGSSSSSNPAYLYAMTGTYDVCLIVVDDCGSDTICQTLTVTDSTSGTGTSKKDIAMLDIEIFPNPTIDLIAIQVGTLVKTNLRIDLIDLSGKVIKSTRINQGSTIAYFDVQAVYEGAYFIKVSNAHTSFTKKVIITRE
ncbi:MAG TPA: YHYH protein [Flavobacteriales bacterium]|nr:YHYH protein [Flavobacteriales bacterium]HIA37333.1 YHYH protein [Flavobacteriales bacterium]HIN39386.1 YHYH protein [Flavobacteriales bacterium]